jgi:cytochrome b subunit of formate dehydrogenase
MINNSFYFFRITRNFRQALMSVPNLQPENNELYKTNMNYKRYSSLFTIILFLLVLTTSVKINAQTNDDCLTCHSDSTLTMVKNKKTVSLFANANTLSHSAHQKLQCIACHVGFDINNTPHKANIQPIDCKSCHKDAALKHPFHPQMMKANSVTGGVDVNCKNCHGTHDVISPKTPGSKFYYTNIVDACGNCHKSEKEKYLLSAHATGLKEGIKGAPNCFTCHKNQITGITVKRDPAQLKITQEKLCVSCHLNNPEIRERTSPSAGFIAAYENSIHGKMLMQGNSRVANCVSCHTAHSIKPGSDPASTVNRFNIPNTCSQCHAEIANEYKGSIHGVAVLKKGSIDAPVCTNCHGEHNILKHNDPNAPTAFANLSTQVCSPCHSSVKLSAKYGLNPNRESTFKSSYHGMALQGGSTTVANCASCHGAHNIRSASDPQSTVYKGNLAKTCGKCHPGANENFAVGKIHVQSTDEKGDPIIYWIASIYIAMIFSVIGAMLLHNLLDFIKKSRIKKLRQMGMLPGESHGHSLYLRMSVSERIQHILLTLSFMTLVLTGFMLHFPDSWWVKHIRDLSENAFLYRGILHRIAAVILIGTSLYHIFYIAFTERGRQLVKDLWPKRQDLFDALGVAKFNLGLSKMKPRLDRFSYVEKAEYWALVWGTIVMSLTGLIMWFDNTFIGLFTKLGWDIARTIHYYEAWMAFLAIIVWHFYFVIFNPEIYPMSTSWITGKITEEEMNEEHPLELDKIKQKKFEEEEKAREKEDRKD